MIRKRLLSIFAFVAIFSSLKVNAQFPYEESFTKKTAPGITFGGAPEAFLTANTIDPDGSGYLRLTSNKQNQKGFIYSDRIFPSTFGLRVEFEYFTYGGNGADGITFFLFDATADPFLIGGFGGSLGYAQNISTIPISPGLSKGYLGIGLDEFGNFSNATEGRQGGPGLKPGSVTIRGAGNGSATVPNNYKYLTSLQTADLGFNLSPAGASERAPLSTDPNYRKVFINLKPSLSGYDVSVKILVGGVPTQTYTVINNFHYDQAAPSTLKYGIASSTGSSINFHEIRN
ncbi:MAG: thrombospondin type 3 repeat family, partial [Daejeonella sp.]|nr:thrombospondin type 3 repeat family [Daejeonella sp.]